ncbi:hypothetical protein AUH73_06030 [archaeon 13_1_40CM_4_53_4]|nr:MAG: hypothetical protein AUI07_08890 [archaeon 13_2_20CM_2_53_6]OLC61953.1 MAG: hypothetical protein AUH73_06030 [archaeon 13_1_40CM_4_53_4]OLE58557.1 MAG: hypothetical protein AUG17_07070 [Crenarchaeota archaeon 13_1_20CM_2_53_14]
MEDGSESWYLFYLTPIAAQPLACTTLLLKAIMAESLERSSPSNRLVPDIRAEARFNSRGATTAYAKGLDRTGRPFARNRLGSFFGTV